MQPKFTLNEKGMLHIENLHFHIPSGNENACRSLFLKCEFRVSEKTPRKFCISFL